MADRIDQMEHDPTVLFRKWMADAEAKELNDPVAAALATATTDGHPSVRMVLVKKFDESGFSFFTNAESRKGHELQTNPRAALCFHWKSLRRQVRAEGRVSQLPDPVVDEYFHSRSRGSQIAAAVSHQSRPLRSREQLDQEVAAFTASLNGQEVPRPGSWKGYLLTAEAIEFWADGADRLHDRVLFRATVGGWTRELLYP